MELSQDPNKNAPQGAEDAAIAANAGTESTPSLEEMIRQAELKAEEHHDAWLRAKAETENVRRRAQEDIAKASKFAVERFADEVCAAHGVEFILPAHGYVLGGPVLGARNAIAKLKAHRLAREAKVLAAMQALPDGSLEQWVEHAYADVPPRLWPVAQRSLLAHVERIRMLEPGND